MVQGGMTVSKSLLYYMRQGSLNQKASVILGIAGSGLGILLWIILIFFNPYSSDQTEPGTLSITFFMLCLPAIVGLLSLVFNRLKLLWVVFIWTLPFGLYLAATPGIFNLYGIVLVIYLFAAILGSIRKTNTKI